MTAEDSDLDYIEDVKECIPVQEEDDQHYVILEVRSGSAAILHKCKKCYLHALTAPNLPVRC